MIRTVVFDIGNVVCTFDPDRRLHELSRRTGLEPNEIHDAIWTSGLEARAEAGQLSPADTERALIDALDRRIEPDSLRAAWSTAFTLDPRVCGLVRDLDLPAFAFTNNGPMFSKCLEHELRALPRLFQCVICSWQLRARKPEPAAFERLGAELHRSPGELLFVDDDPKNVASARSAGLAAVQFTSAEQLALDLESLSSGLPE